MTKKYWLKAEFYLRRIKKHSAPKERPLIKIEDLKECPFPPEPELQEWEEEWTKKD